MDTSDFGTKIKELFNKSAKASKEALDKAGAKAQDLSDKGVKKFTIHQLETKRDCKYEELGLKISQMLLEGVSVQSEKEEDVAILLSIQDEIKGLSSQITSISEEFQS